MTCSTPGCDCYQADVYVGRLSPEQKPAASRLYEETKAAGICLREVANMFTHKLSGSNETCADCRGQGEALIRACPHLNSFLRDPARARLYAAEALLLSLGCRLTDVMTDYTTFGGGTVRLDEAPKHVRDFAALLRRQAEARGEEPRLPIAEVERLVPEATGIVERILDGTQPAALITLDMVSKLFAPFGLQVELRLKKMGE